MQKLSQKYVIVHLIDDLPVGYEYSMNDWPLHVTLADVFAIESSPSELLYDLDKELSLNLSIKSKVIGEKWFGEDKNVHVKSLQKTEALQQLHDAVIRVLEAHGVKFNSPQYTKEGFVPHSTVQKSGELECNDIVIFNSITLIDMFPENNPLQRRILGTINFNML